MLLCHVGVRLMKDVAVACKWAAHIFHLAKKIEGKDNEETQKKILERAENIIKLLVAHRIRLHKHLIFVNSMRIDNDM